MFTKAHKLLAVIFQKSLKKLKNAIKGKFTDLK